MSLHRLQRSVDFVVRLRLGGIHFPEESTGWGGWAACCPRWKAGMLL